MTPASRPTRLRLERYTTQRERWPRTGRVILAHYDAHEVVVYQAFHPATAAFAVEHQQFGGPRYSRSRMSWIKPNFLWMMFRCGWLQKDDEQGRVLAIGLDRAFFDQLLEAAVASSWDRARYPDQPAWQRALKRSEVRLQWDPDHGPSGAKVERRAIQLGLRGDTLARFVDEGTRWIEDISDYVVVERSRRSTPELVVPREAPYPIPSPAAAKALGVEVDDKTSIEVSPRVSTQGSDGSSDPH
ncbi:MAG: DUF4291 domain-containing protein [Myxococcota bacterium]